MMCMALMAMMTACGGNTEKKNGAAGEQNAQPTAEATAEPATEQTDVESDDSALSLGDFGSALQEVCGITPITNDKMTDIKTWIEENDTQRQYYMTSPVADDIDKEAVQGAYFDAFAKVADGNKIYGFYMDHSRGTDAFSSYEEYTKFIKANGTYAKANYAFDYQGKPIEVNCAVAFGDFGLTVKVDT